MTPTITDVWVGSVGNSSWLDFLICPNKSYPFNYDDAIASSPMLCNSGPYSNAISMPNTLSLDNAFDIYAYATERKHRRAILFTDGCQVGLGSTPDCSKACSNITMAFQDMVTTSNCLQYPLVMAALETNALSNESVELVGNVGISDSPSSLRANAVYDCLGNFSVAFQEQYGTNVSSVAPVNICDMSTSISSVNPDIGGIGVFISYYRAKIEARSCGGAPVVS